MDLSDAHHVIRYLCRLTLVDKVLRSDTHEDGALEIPTGDDVDLPITLPELFWRPALQEYRREILVILSGFGVEVSENG